MLILTRHSGDKVFLIDRSTGAAIATIQVIWVDAVGTCAIGVDAPGSVQILRDDARLKVPRGISACPTCEGDRYDPESGAYCPTCSGDGVAPVALASEA